MLENRLTLTERTVNAVIKGITGLICRVDAGQLARVPSRGPLILVSNHINFLEIPIIYTHIQPSSVTGFAKAETWDSRFLGPLFNLWNIIPLRRGDADLSAIRRALAALADGKIIAVTPEGTRSGHGRLGKAHAGVVTLALQSDAPLLPVVHYGGEAYRKNLPRLRRTDFHVIVGQPFKLEPGSERVTRRVRQQMADEIMYQLASLLPPPYRGEYADLNLATQQYLRFEEPL
jgi:1-acyl-sn-glycerol-3-phosphate acyltransferase